MFDFFSTRKALRNEINSLRADLDVEEYYSNELQEKLGKARTALVEITKRTKSTSPARVIAEDTLASL